MENQIKKRLPIGISDFETIITNDYYFVDKSLFIKEIIDNKAMVTLLPRPRRFGKTLNLSMTKYFFESHPDIENKKHLFDNLYITKHEDIMKLQGKYPVIFLTFKDIKVLTWENCFYGIKSQISLEYSRHKYLLESNILNKKEKNKFQNIINEKEDINLFSASLFELSKYLNRYHKQKVVILIDEYDTPIHAGYIYKYYDQIIAFMRTFLSGGLKDNINLDFSIITGILRVAKESIFSGLNNLEVMTILDDSYSDKFGFTQYETEELLNTYTEKDKVNIIREAQDWYNGYKFSEHQIYNPWSILNFAKRKKIAPYWVNTSSNDIIKQLVRSGNRYFRNNLQELIEGKLIDKHVNDNIVFQDIDKKLDTLWSFLLFSGYLTYSDKRIVGDSIFCKLRIPNREIAYVFEDIIMGWLEEGLDLGSYQLMLQNLVDGNIDEFKSFFINSIIESASFFDTSGKTPENFYHALVLGMLISLNQTHLVKSNRESGYGRYDIMIIPKDKNKIGVIIEFKVFDKTKEKTIDDTVQRALQQIEDKKYETELQSLGIKNIIKLAIVFKGKEVLIKAG